MSSEPTTRQSITLGVIEGHPRAAPESIASSDETAPE